MNKIIYIILDGAAGRPNKTLNNKTALEKANTPAIDSLFRKSINGLMNVVGPNIAPQSDIATFALMGYNPFNVPSRGVIEAIGSGYEYKQGEIAMRCNLAVINKGKLEKPRLSFMTKEEGKEIEQLINEGVSLDAPFTFKHTKDYRGVLIIHKKLPANVTNTHPGYIRERLGTELLSYAVRFRNEVKIKECKALSPDSIETANIINDFIKQSQEVLVNAGVKANYILIRGAGNNLPEIKSFEETNGFKMALVARMPVELGVAKILGLDIIQETSKLNTLLNSVLNSLSNHQAVYAHIKGPDKYGHIGDAYGKVKAIERIDEEFIKPLITKVNLNETTICITSDHATPACFGVHTSDPVPYLITNNQKTKGHFCEKTVNKEFIEGKELMKKIIEIAKT